MHPTDRRVLLARWAAARNLCVDALLDAGLPVDDEWPPAWHTRIPRTLAEHEALVLLGLLETDGGLGRGLPER